MKKNNGQATAVPPLPDGVDPETTLDFVSLQRQRSNKAAGHAAPLPKPRHGISHYPLLKGVSASLQKPRFEFDFLLT